MWQGKVPSLAFFSFSMLLLKGNVMGNTGALWASCIVMLWLNAALIWQVLFMLARTNNFFTGLVSLLFRAHKVLPFLNCIQDRNSAREVGLYFSFTLMAHVHNAGDVIPPICSCIHARRLVLFYANTHNVSASLSRKFFHMRFHFREGERWCCRERWGHGTKQQEGNED